MQCIVCADDVEDNHTHLMSGKFLTERAKLIAELQKQLRYCHCCQMEYCECNED